MTVIKSDALQCGDIGRLLHPKSIAIIGASDKPGALGATVLSNLDNNGYQGAVHLINPKREAIGGRACLPSIEQLPDAVDLAILAIPRVAVMDSLRLLAERKVGAAIIFSAGFAEGGEEGLADQAEIGRIAKDANMIVEGPNCLGSVNYKERLPLTFVETKISGEKHANSNGIGIISQSGAMAAVLGVVLNSRKLNLTYSVSTGNEAASGVESYVDFLINDPDTKIIAMVVEQFRQPKHFLDVAKRATAAGKTIVLLHPGKSSAARESAATHTGAMAGDYKLMRAKVARAGVVMAETLEELGDITEIISRCATLPSKGTAVLGESGAFKALTLDLCEELELYLPALGDEDSPKLRAALPDFVPVSNPLDLTAQGLSDPDMYYRVLDALFGDDRVGTILAGIIQTDPVTIGIKMPPILRAMRDLKPDKPIIFAGLDEGAVIPVADIDSLRAQGVPYFPSTERAFRAIKRISAALETDANSVNPGHVEISGLPQNGGVIAEYKAKEILSQIGINFPKGAMATSAKEAAKIGETIGFPVVMKAQSADLSHKSDAGGVILKLSSAEDIRAAWEKMHGDVAQYDSSVQLDGVLIEKMGTMGLELIIGAKNDPDWGPIILAGFGGVTAEILQDVRLLSPDMSKQAIIAELGRLKSAALLHGYRGSPALDLDAIAETVQKIGALMLSEPRIQEIDLNPVIIYPNGEGVIALDALIISAKG